MSQPSVCILTAGTGRRSGPFADIINKCLLPYQGRAIISHIIDHFPPTMPIVIALGYKGEQVKAYLTLMHPERSFTFVTVDRYTGEGTGPGYSLMCCKPALPGAFYFVAGDGWFQGIPAATDKNWVALGRTGAEDLASYCNIGYDPALHCVTRIYDKVKPPEAAETGIFTGLMFIKDAKAFWEGLAKSTPTTNEIQIAQGFAPLMAQGDLHTEWVEWRDLGTFALYRDAIDHAFDFSKTDEFIYLSDTRVVKFFTDAKIVAQRVKKTEYLPQVFPTMVGMDGQFYGYEKVPGNTMYEMLDGRLFARLLQWLKQEFWKPYTGSAAKEMRALCQTFYHDKTRARVAAYQKKYPDVIEATTVNGRPVLPIATLLDRLPASLVDGVAVFMHGDLQFDNIITDGTHFTLIDWRQDFAGETAFGDWYYDLAKMLGGIHLNYDYIKRGLMRFSQEGADVWIDYATRAEAPAYAKQLEAFVEEVGLDFRRVQLLRGLIYLNMAPLHHAPFDRLLYALAQRTLTDHLA